MVWRIGLALSLLLWASPASTHEPVLLDVRRATRGLGLELMELPVTTTPASTARYRLRVSGLPRGVMFGVWAKDFSHVACPQYLDVNT
jgi:hypothetical protein